MTGVELHLKRDHDEIGGHVARVSAAPGGVKVEGLDLEGAGVGELKGGLRVVGKEIVGTLRGENVDLGKVAQLVQYPGHLKGLANVDIELASTRPGSRTGHVALELVDGEAEMVTGVSGVFSATFAGDQVRTDGLWRIVARAAAGEKAEERCDGAIASLRVTGGDGRLPGPSSIPRAGRGRRARSRSPPTTGTCAACAASSPPWCPCPRCAGSSPRASPWSARRARGCPRSRASSPAPWGWS